MDLVLFLAETMSALFDHLAAHRDQLTDPSVEKALWDRFGVERTVLVLDMAGFTRIARDHGVVHYLGLIHDMRLLMSPLVVTHGGHVVKAEADNLFAVFEQPVDSLAFVDAAFVAAARFNQDKAEVAQLKLCMGLDHGRILLDREDFFGDAVNAASKLGEDMARSGEVLVSQAIHDRVPEWTARLESIGHHGVFSSGLAVYRLRRVEEH